MKTPKSIILERKKTYQEIFSEYSKMVETICKLRLESIDNPEAKVKYNEILESSEFQKLEDLLTHGPIYDITKEDLEDKDYEMATGFHPLNDDKFKEIYQNGKIFGAEFDKDRIIECLAYDYNNQFYYKLMPKNNINEKIYIPICNR